mmetsp:Transcript_9048/g.28817  ORF Transcript_9048/g.28817 Transcript_9048/m.28817 type:complete len:273 (+) Transcript_9048:280-1098(+)
MFGNLGHRVLLHLPLGRRNVGSWRCVPRRRVGRRRCRGRRCRGRAGPVDGHSLCSRVHPHRKGARAGQIARTRARTTRGSRRLQQRARGRCTGDTAVHHAVQQGRAAQPVGSVDAAARLTRNVRASRRPVGTKHRRVRRRRQAAHAVVHDGRDGRNVKLVVGHPRHVLKVLAAVTIASLFSLVELGKRPLECGKRHTLRLGKGTPRLVVAHEAAARIVLAVPLNFAGRPAVQHQKVVGVLAPLFLGPVEHLFGHVVTVAELVAEPLTASVEE